MKRQIVCFATILSMVLAVSILNVEAEQETVQKHPTSNSGAWSNGLNAYVSDDAYAISSIRNAEHKYGDYNFDNSIPDDAIIDKVEVGIEFYLSSSSYSIDLAVTWDNETSWSDYTTIAGTTETLEWVDATDLTDWTKEKLKDENYKVKVVYRTSGGGCYPNNLHIVATKNPYALGKTQSGLLQIEDWGFFSPQDILDSLEKKEKLYCLSWTHEKGWFVDEQSIIVKVDSHQGDWILYDIYSGELDISYTDPSIKKETTIHWKSHIELTDNHKMHYSLDNKTWLFSTTESLYQHWRNNETVYVNHLWWNYTLKPFAVTDVKSRKFTGTVYNVWTKGDLEGKDEVFFKKGKTLSQEEYDTLMRLKSYGVPIGQFPPFLVVMQKVPWTAYLDWLPVKVTYSEIGDSEIGGSAGAGTPSSRINALGAMIYSGLSFLWNGLFFLWTEKIYLPFLLLWTQGKITVEGCLASIFIVLMSYFISKNICNFLFKRKKR